MPHRIHTDQVLCFSCTLFNVLQARFFTILLTLVVNAVGACVFSVSQCCAVCNLYVDLFNLAVAAYKQEFARGRNYTDRVKATLCPDIILCSRLCLRLARCWKLFVISTSCCYLMKTFWYLGSFLDLCSMTCVSWALGFLTLKNGQARIQNNFNLSLTREFRSGFDVSCCLYHGSADDVGAKSQHRGLCCKALQYLGR